MKIISIFESINGGEQVATEYMLQALQKRGHQVTVHTLSSLECTSTLSYTLWIAKSVITSLWIVWRYRHYQVFYTTTFTALLAAVLLQPFTHQKISFHYHGNRIPDVLDRDSPLLRRWTQSYKHWLAKMLHQFGWARTAIFFVPSSFILQQLFRQFSRLGRKQVIVPNGVDHQKFRPVSAHQKRILRKKYQVPTSAFVCAVIARLEKNKNILASLAVIQALHKERKEGVFLMLVTSTQTNQTDYAAQVRDELNTLSIPFQWVTNTAEVFTREIEMAVFYQLSDCVISHSAQEVFPLVLLEAAACEVPYFAKKNGITEQYLQKIDPCLILPASPLKAAQQVICCAKRTELCRKLRQFAAQYSWEKSVQTVEKAFAT